MATSHSAAIILTELVVAKTGPFHRMLEFAPLVHLGRISYGLYLWQSAIFCHGLADQNPCVEDSHGWDAVY
jgi:peptidoglycan/LPS O-acetylase OafA/YrhL